MSMNTRPAALLTAAPCRPSDRRERSPLPSSPGYGSLPFFERNDHQSQYSAAHRPASPPDERLGQIIHMAATGVWVIKRNGQLAEIAGRMHWESREALVAAAGGTMPLSTIAIHTGRVG